MPLCLVLFISNIPARSHTQTRSRSHYNDSQLHEPIESVELRCYADAGAGGKIGADNDELDVLGGAWQGI